MGTVQQGGLRSLAVDVVQKDQTNALTEYSIRHDLSVTPARAEEVKI